jgi:hypothetical protein
MRPVGGGGLECGSRIHSQAVLLVATVIFAAKNLSRTFFSGLRMVDRSATRMSESVDHQGGGVYRICH